MPRLSTSAKLAAISILLLSFAHIVFWILIAVVIRYFGLNDSQFAILHVAIWVIAAAGFVGLVVAVGILKARNWARIATLALGALTALVCTLALFVLFILIANRGGFGLFDNLVTQNRGNFVCLALIYLIILLLAVWWIVLFSRKRIAEQFSDSSSPAIEASSNKSKCPPPIALLAWLMFVSAALSAFSWPLILGKIPVMLFTHIFAPQPSRLIWIANILLFAVCGIGLLKLQHWSYTGTIALHLFWLVSLLITQLSSNYETYSRICLNTLDLAETYPVLNRVHVPQWISATMTALPTALLIAGLFYYRRSFLDAAEAAR